MKPVHKKMLVMGAPTLLLVLALAGAWHWWRSRRVEPGPVMAAAVTEEEEPKGPVVRGMPRHNVGVWPPGPPEDTGIGYSHRFAIDPRTHYNTVPRENRYAPTR